MLNLQTILSTFDCKGTLLKWLKLLEAALQEGVLESVEIKKIDNSNAQLIMNFADGTQSVSNAFELPQGPTGATGPAGPAGPAGPVGPTGPKGDTAEVTVQQLHSLIEGSPTVVADINEAGTAINIHLDADYKNKVDRSLQLPTAQPSTPLIVTILQNGSQSNVALGDGLVLTSGKISATAEAPTFSMWSLKSNTTTGYNADGKIYFLTKGTYSASNESIDSFFRNHAGQAMLLQSAALVSSNGTLSYFAYKVAYTYGQGFKVYLYDIASDDETNMNFTMSQVTFEGNI